MCILQYKDILYTYKINQRKSKSNFRLRTLLQLSFANLENNVNSNIVKIGIQKGLKPVYVNLLHGLLSFGLHAIVVAYFCLILV